MEMNTRLQVEHPVTELVTGIDLVELQVRVAAGEALPVAQDDITMTGHAIEARVYAEDPAHDFLPTGGTVLALAESTDARVDSGIRAGSVIGSDYDPMLSKIIAYGLDRESARRGLDRALAEDVIAGRLDTGLLDRRTGDYVAAQAGDDEFIAAAAYRWLHSWSDAGELWATPTGWRVGEHAPTTIRQRAGDRTDHVHLTGTPAAATARIEEGEPRSVTASLAGDRLIVTVDGLRTEYLTAVEDHRLWLAGAGRTTVIEDVREAPVRADDEHSGDAEIVSPMPGSVVAVGVEDGSTVGSGDVVVTVEAMKMEHALSSPVGGTVELLVAVGDQVKVGQPLARITAATEETK